MIQSDIVLSKAELQRTSALAISLVIGNVISFCLFGALTVQLYMYQITFINDSRRLKASIYIIYLAEAVFTALLAYDLVRLAVNPDYNGCLSSLTIPVCGGLVALLTQAVYAHRIWAITGMKFIPLLLVVLMTIEVVTTAVLISLFVSFFIVALVWAGCCLCSDLTIAIIMWRTLTKDKIYHKDLRRRIGRLLQLTVGCGFLTVAVNIATLVSSLYSESLTLALGIVLSKIYANSMMVLVNSRDPPEEASHQAATLQIDTLQFGHLSVGPTATTTMTTTDEERQEQQLKSTFTSGEAREEQA